AIIGKFRYVAMAGDIQSQQRGLLQGLMSASRLNRLTDAELLTPDKAYTAIELIKDVQDGIWSELQMPNPKIDPLRRNLQETYVSILKREFDPSTPAAQAGPGRPQMMPGAGGSGRSPELRAIARVTLRDLAKQLETALPKVQDVTTRAHLE